MYPALVRLSTVVALTTSLVATPALALAAPPPAGSLHATRAAHLTSDTDETDHSDPWGGGEHDEHDQHDEPSIEQDEPEEPVDSRDDHTDHATPTQDRPRVQMLSAFGGLNGAVLVSAALVRRRDREKPRHRPRASTAPNAADHRRTSR